ncbi:hypothetical protein EOD23_01255 [Mesorhizobium sp. USDA-HM6]|nr:hypothetical protein EOD23_01255 [Mesorhizobium sp. USDA-HM6]
MARLLINVPRNSWSILNRPRPLNFLGGERVTEVSSGDIERLVRDISAGKTAKDEKLGKRRRIIVRGGEGAARKVARDLSAVFNFAIRRKIAINTPCDTAAIRKTDNRRERYLSIEEVKRLGHALETLESQGVNPKALNITRLSRQGVGPLRRRCFVWAVAHGLGSAQSGR